MTWHDAVEDIIEHVEPGDRVTFEYDSRTTRGRVGKTGTVTKVSDLKSQSKITVDVDGAENPWVLAVGVSTEYDHDRDGRQSRYLGQLNRIKTGSGGSA